VHGEMSRESVQLFSGSQSSHHLFVEGIGPLPEAKVMVLFCCI